MAIGVGLMVIGFGGTFFASMIKAAVSRQREFLADASAVQFTRQPDGIAGALKTIGGLSHGSRVESPNALQASHLFFGLATSGLTSVFSTHPPLGERIRRLDPSWDGQFPASTGQRRFVAMPETAMGLGRSQAGAVRHARRDEPENGRRRHWPAHRGSAGPRGTVTRESPEAACSGGTRALRGPRRDLRAVDRSLIDTRTAQQEHLSRAADPGVLAETKRVLPMVERIDVEARLPLVEITLAALRELTPTQYQAFKENVDMLVSADQSVGLFEWAVHRILLHDLEIQVGHKPPRRGPHRPLQQLGSQCEVMLSTLAHVGHAKPEAVAKAFDEGWRHLGLSPGRPRSVQESGFEALDAAMTDLESAEPQAKRRLAQAAAACIGADLTVTVYEVELLRTVSAILGCPMPPLVPTTR